MIPSGTEQIRLAMIGGGPGSLIGAVHRQGALRDDHFRLVAGVFGRDRQRSRDRAREWGVAEDRVYADHEALIEAEASRCDGVEAIAITTPNHAHFAAAAAALRAGLHVICDKPMTATLAQAEELAAIAATARGTFALTYTYTGYPMIREARHQVAAGAIGNVRKIMVDYSQGWLAAEAAADNRQAAWRTDPALAGAGGCIGDIGVHAFQLAEHVSGLRTIELCASLARVVPGRLLDDDANILMRMTGGVPAVLTASQIAFGERNNVRLRVYGEAGSLDWSHERPEELRILRDDSVTILYAAGRETCHHARAATRLPPGHPEGFTEAFANIYADVADAVRTNSVAARERLIDAREGLRSLQFIAAVVASDEIRGWRIMEDAA